jgi:hypothetical protein
MNTRMSLQTQGAHSPSLLSRTPANLALAVGICVRLHVLSNFQWEVFTIAHRRTHLLTVSHTARIYSETTEHCILYLLYFSWSCFISLNYKVFANVLTLQNIPRVYVLNTEVLCRILLILLNIGKIRRTWKKFICCCNGRTQIVLIPIQRMKPNLRTGSQYCDSLFER